MTPTDPPPPPNYWGEPELPQGDTGLPPIGAFSYLPTAPIPQGATPADPALQDQQYDVNLLTDEILGQFTVDQRVVIRAWFPLVWNKPSQYLGGTVVNNFAYLLQHADAYNRDQLKAQWKADVAARRDHREQRKLEREAELASKALQADRWLEYTRQCQMRMDWIEAKRVEWKARMEQAKAGKAQWDGYVKEARVAFTTAKDTPAPPRPV